MHPERVEEAGINALRDRYHKVRSYSEKLCEPLEREDFVPQPVVDVSPSKWHIAHTTWFFEELILKPFFSSYCVFDPAYSFLFNSYYESVGERTLRHKRGDLSRPTVDTVFRYRAHVDEFVERFLDSGPAAGELDLLLLGTHHEQQHQELFLTDLKYTFALNPLAPVYDSGKCLVESGGIRDEEYCEIPAGEYEVGHNGEGFCFDNELGRHAVRLAEYRIARSPVTNGEFLEFIDSGGYSSFNHWHSEGWDWVKTNGIDSPLYWRKIDGEWYHFTLAGLRRIRTEDPVCHISFYEASAFASWKGRRLPTEFEWEAASGQFRHGERWEWTNSAYLPYPGFRISEGAVGEYNGKFMVNQMVLRGGSAATPAGHARNTYRNFFHPYLRWQFNGIRLAE